MKKLILVSALLLSFTFGAVAQDRSINFEETKVWAEIINKAKKEKKLIFVDCYTDWCGPCKTLSANVFTQNNVADFFNKNFVNAKFEMEKDADGVARKDVWGIKAYPTLIFVDPNTESVIHRLVGAGKAEWLIDGGEIAMDPSRNLNSLIERYNKGDRDSEFLAGYLKALKAAYMSDEQAIVATEYFKSLSVDQLATPQNWLLLSENVTDPLSKPLRQVMANREKFYNIEGVGQLVVDRKLSSSLMGATMSVAQWLPGRGEFSQSRYDDLVKYLNEIDYPAKEQALAWLNSSSIFRKGDWKGLLADMRKVETSQIFKSNSYSQYFQFFVESLGYMSDKGGVSEGIKLIDQKIASIKGEDSNSYFAKSGLAESKQRLYKATGNELAAENAKAEMEEYAKEGQAASGGKMQRAARMN